jgi:hypothetical protein
MTKRVLIIKTGLNPQNIVWAYFPSERHFKTLLSKEDYTYQQLDSLYQNTKSMIRHLDKEER